MFAGVDKKQKVCKGKNLSYLTYMKIIALPECLHRARDNLSDCTYKRSHACNRIRLPLMKTLHGQKCRNLGRGFVRRMFHSF